MQNLIHYIKNQAKTYEDKGPTDHAASVLAIQLTLIAEELEKPKPILNQQQQRLLNLLCIS